MVNNVNSLYHCEIQHLVDNSIARRMASHVEPCCNPFGIPKHNYSSRKKSLRPVSKWMLNKANIPAGSKICDSCRKRLAKLPDLDTVVESFAECDAIDDQYIDTPQAVSAVNKCLQEIVETPLPSTVRSSKRVVQKMDSLAEKMKDLILDQPSGAIQKDDENEMLLQLKEKFESSSNRSEKLLILTVLPKSWKKGLCFCKA